MRQHFIFLPLKSCNENYPKLYKVNRHYQGVGCNATYTFFETSVLESINGGQINLSTQFIKLNIRKNSNKLNCTRIVVYRLLKPKHLEN